MLKTSNYNTWTLRTKFSPRGHGKKKIHSRHFRYKTTQQHNINVVYFKKDWGCWTGEIAPKIRKFKTKLSSTVKQVRAENPRESRESREVATRRTRSSWCLRNLTINTQRKSPYPYNSYTVAKIYVTLSHRMIYRRSPFPRQKKKSK